MPKYFYFVVRAIVETTEQGEEHRKLLEKLLEEKIKDKTFTFDSQIVENLCEPCSIEKP